MAASTAPPQQDSGVVESQAKRRRLAQDVIGQLQDNIKADPHDVASWRNLLQQYQNRDQLDELNDAYEKLLLLYPYSGELWTGYIESALARAEFPRAEKLFARCLNKVPYVPLWSSYISYIRRVNLLKGANVDQAKSYSVITQAYEYALGKIQFDPESGTLWQQYIELIEQMPAQSSWDKQQQMDETRKLYRRAVSIPLVNVETLWKNYNNFENNVSKSTARKFINDRSPAYMNARSYLQGYRSMTARIDRTTLPPARKYDEQEATQLALWRALLAREISDPLKLGDREQVRERVVFLYKQASVSLCMFAELWFDASEYCLSESDSSTAIEFLNNGLEIIPKSFLLTTKLASIYEQNEDFDNANNTHRKRIKALEPAATSNEPNADYTIAYAELMKCVKRGAGLKEARQIFSEARKAPCCTHHIYCASASMEQMNGNSSVAGKIFEIAYKKFRDDVSFLQAYMDYLIKAADEINARVVFEKAVTDLNPLLSRPLWDSLMKYESLAGNLQALEKLERRYLSIYADTSSVELFGRRYTQYGADPVGAELHITQHVLTQAAGIPPALAALLDKLPPEDYYDGPAIDVPLLVTMIAGLATA